MNERKRYERKKKKKQEIKKKEKAQLTTIHKLAKNY